MAVVEKEAKGKGQKVKGEEQKIGNWKLET
jgi:hypothetical protein